MQQAPAKIWAVHAWLIDSGTQCSKVIPMDWNEDEQCWVGVKELKVKQLGEVWNQDFAYVSFASVSKEEVETFFNGLGAGAHLFSLWMKIREEDPNFFQKQVSA